MSNQNEKLNELLKRLNELSGRQNELNREMNDLRLEIHKMKAESTEPKVVPKEQKRPATVRKEPSETETPTGAPYLNLVPKTQSNPSKVTKEKRKSSNLEKYIGENLINKIGILIIIIGVGIGAKYAIDNQLISPLTRIILGYLVGAGLLVFAIRLKEKYENFSAVLLSGAMAIMYFITYLAYILYELIPQPLTFGLMVFFTAFTVPAALRYDKAVIAHIGLVGAYAVPFLLGGSPGQAAVLFSYIAIINIGILIIAFRKNWLSLFHAAYTFSWLIFASWYLFNYRNVKDFGIGLTFAAIFFLTFYAMFLAYKLVRKEQYGLRDGILLISNSFIFFLFGYSMLADNEIGEQLLGLYTLLNAALHFGIGLLIKRQQLADNKLFYLVIGLVLVFITIAVPVQFEGNWVPILWMSEAAVLFWFGRTKEIPIYENLSLPLMLLGLLSLTNNWMEGYRLYGEVAAGIFPLFLNQYFFTSCFFIAAFGFIYYTIKITPKTEGSKENYLSGRFLPFFVPTVLITLIYLAFFFEMQNYWNLSFNNSILYVGKQANIYSSYLRNWDLLSFKSIWLINYTLAFLSILGVLNIRRFKSEILGFINFLFLAITIVLFLTQGLVELGNLRHNYLDQVDAEYYYRGVFNIIIRYISYLFVSISLWICYWYFRQAFMEVEKLGYVYDVLLFGSILCIASSELYNWMDLLKNTRHFDIGLSILFGIYALVMIVIGVWKKKKHLRILAIGLFGLTLFKLFFFDIAHLDTLSKTIVFVTLGILLLIISFLYNKYKNLISDENEA